MIAGRGGEGSLAAGGVAVVRIFRHLRFGFCYVKVSVALLCARVNYEVIYVGVLFIRRHAKGKGVCSMPVLGAPYLSIYLDPQ